MNPLTEPLILKNKTERAETFSLVLAGPLYQLLLRSRLIRPPLGHLGWGIGAITALAWLPHLHSRVLTGVSWVVWRYRSFMISRSN